MQIRFFQPSWFQIKINDKIVYIDPAYLKKYYHNYPGNVLFSTWPDPIDGLPEIDLAKADLILITHHHKDHCKLVTVNRLRKKNTLIIAPLKCTTELGKEIRVVKSGDGINFKEIEIRVVPAYNTITGNSAKKQHKKGAGVGYLIRANDKTIYHAGDTDFIPDMETFGKVDDAMLPIDGTYTMDISEAIQAIKTIQPKVVIPMHNLGVSMLEFKNKADALTNSNIKPLKIGETCQIA